MERYELEEQVKRVLRTESRKVIITLGADPRQIAMLMKFYAALKGFGITISPIDATVITVASRAQSWGRHPERTVTLTLPDNLDVSLFAVRFAALIERVELGSG